MTLAFLLAAASLVSCKKGGTDDNGGNNNPPGGGNTACSGTAGAKFTAVKNILATKCTGCHGGTNPQNGKNFADNCTIVNNKTAIKARAVDHSPSVMPPPPNTPLTELEKSAITAWIDAGGRLTD